MLRTAGLNFKHLRYFLQVADTGSIARASEQLHISPSSSQTGCPATSGSTDQR